MGDESAENLVHQYIQGALEGDENAARMLFRHLHPLVARLVRIRLPKRESEEDLIQTVFIRIFSNLHQYSGKVPIEHWVSRIAINTCWKQLRFESHRPEVRWSDLEPAQQQLLDQMNQNDQTIHDRCAAYEIIEKLLMCLEPQQRALLNLSVFEGKSLIEMSQLTGWTKTNIKIRLFRARQKLKQQYQKLIKERGL